MTEPARTSTSLCFVVVTANDARNASPVIDPLDRSRRDDDQIILLTRSDQVDEALRGDRPWLRVVGIPDADIFELRRHIPTLSNADWIVVLEAHSILADHTITAIRTMCETHPRVDMILMLGKNLTSVSAWDWAAFLHGFALNWAPRESAPPFALVTSVVVRRAALGTDSLLPYGDWEFRLVPELFSRKRYAYSNDIYIDHVKAQSALAHLILNFQNTRACAAILGARGMSVRSLWREARFHSFVRPGTLSKSIQSRRAQLPKLTMLRVRIIAIVSGFGLVIGSLFGKGRSVKGLE